MSGETQGTLLGGRVAYAQPETGHRTGIEPVLLAASLPARAGERVLEGGSGSGAGLLCLAARVPGITGLGLERDPALAALALRNAAANGFAGLGFLAADLAAWRPEARFDHAMANPPWHGAGTASPDAGREGAKRAGLGLFAAWAAALARPLRHRGTLTFIVAAAALPGCMAGFAMAGCGSIALFPLWPRAGLAARLALLRGVKGGRGPCRMLPGLVLHEAGGGFTAEAQQVLRGGAPIAWG
jgi:tRNA1(Val) A37 N6-methylase TrmN6